MSVGAAGLNERYFQQDSPVLESQRQGRTNWSQDVPRKAPQRQGELIDITTIEFSFQQRWAAVRADINKLKEHYVFGDDTIDLFLVDHRALRTTLRNAIDPMKATFGADKIFRLELSIEEDDSKMLYGVTLWPGTVCTAALALNNFVEHWWLDNMNANTSSLAFVYRISR